jgi:cell division septal protein FtsQ
MAEEAAEKLNRSLFIKEGEEEEKKREEEAAANSRSRCHSALKKAVVFAAFFFFASVTICLLGVLFYWPYFSSPSKKRGE